MTLAAIDPWTLNFDGSDHDLRLEALERFFELVDEHPDLHVLRFIDANYDDWFWTNSANYAGTDPSPLSNPLPLQDLTGWLGRLRFPGASPPQGAVAEQPPGRQRWLMEVASAIQSDDNHTWRDPIVFVPKCRKGEWPVVAGETLLSRDLLDQAAPSVRRVLVLIDDPAGNSLFVRDFDPWQSERARQPSEEPIPRDLPRPPDCVKRAMHEWAAILISSIDAISPEVDHLAFIPPQHWDPCAVGKEEWRTYPFGQHGEKHVSGLGKKTGPTDRRGRVWSWDEAHQKAGGHSHWDVQHENPNDNRRMNVRADGLITRRYGD